MSVSRMFRRNTPSVAKPNCAGPTRKIPRLFSAANEYPGRAAVPGGARSDKLHVCCPLHVGAMVCANAGAASERIHVVAIPLTAASPTVAVGLAEADEEVDRMKTQLRSALAANMVEPMELTCVTGMVQ